MTVLSSESERCLSMGLSAKNLDASGVGIGNTDNSSDEIERRASARKKYLMTLRTMTQYGARAKAEVVLRDSTVPVKAGEIKAIASDSSHCVVTDLETVLGSLPAAVLRANDLVSIRVNVCERSPNPDGDTGEDVTKDTK